MTNGQDVPTILERDVYRALLEFTVSEDPALLLERALSAVLEATAADFVLLRLYRWEKVVHAGETGSPALATRTISRAVIRDALQQNRVFRVDNTATDLDQYDIPPTQRPRLGSLLVAPIGRHGALYLESARSGCFGPDHERIARAFANALAPFAARVVADPLLGEARPDAPPALARDAGIPGVSDATEKARELVARFAGSELTFCILGPPGSGKTELARFVHSESRRRGPFVDVNCAAIPSPLFESTLFGHLKGAFTGATVDRPGLVEQAAGGTLFLDEIDGTPLECQAKLLKVIETKRVMRVGDVQSRPVDVRFVVATNRDLRAAVAERAFRDDLWARLSEVPVHLTSLAERPEDIGALAHAILARHGGDPPPVITYDGLAMLQRQRWPGNVRQLATVLRLALAENEGVRYLGRAELAAAMHVQGLEAETADRPPTLDEALAAYERQLIVAALSRHDGNVTKAALELGRDRRYLHARMKALKIRGRG